MTMYRNNMRGSMSGCNRCEPRRCRREDPLEGLALGIAYVPWQNWNTTYEAEKGLHRGTIFPELDKPFCGTGGNHS